MVLKMKQASTLKLEITGPSGMPWSDVKPRLFALRKTAAQALTMTMQDVHADAVGELRSYWLGESKEQRRASSEWRKQMRNKLARNWKAVLARELVFRGAEDPEAQRACEAVTDALVGETVDNIAARFSGQHFKDLIALRGGFPSFVNGCSFYAEGRKSEIEGAPDAARIGIPLWGSGKKLTWFALGIGGGSARAQWRKLVADFPKRDQVVQLEKDAKDPAKKTAAEKTLQRLGLCKMGRVGITYDERRRKWYATISYTQHRPDNYKEGQKAALNFGVNVFLQAVAEDGASWQESGEQILAKRIASASIRKRIQRSMRTFGSGSKGRGKRRRELPLMKRQGGEQRFVETYIRQLSAQVIAWCKRQGVSDLYLEELGGIREAFERSTSGDAHPEVKRRIHHWPYYQTAQAIERQGSEFGVRVHVKSSHYNSQRCPDCGHTVPENIEEITVPGIPIVFKQTGVNRWASGPLATGGDMYRHHDKTWRFNCKGCGKRGQTDMVSCVNMLLDVGATFGGKPSPFQKAQEAAKKTVSSDKRKKIRRTGS